MAVEPGSFNRTSVFDRWLDETVPIDPMLKEPFDLGGQVARRRTLARVLLEQLGLEQRLQHGRLRASSYEVLFDMLDPLGDTRNTMRVHVPDRARAVCGEANNHGYPEVDRTRAATALLDLGWGHAPIEGGEARHVFDDMRITYIDLMSKRVITMFRRWEREGWLTDSDHMHRAAED